MSLEVNNTFEKLNSTIQSILTKFKICQKPSDTSFYFSSNPNVYETESQIPELWIKSHNPINKNNSFFFENNSYLPSRANLFPKTPFIIPFDNPISTKEGTIGKIDLDALFLKDENKDGFNSLKDEEDNLNQRISPKENKKNQ